MIEYLNELDTYFFLLINGFHNSFFDVVMTYVSSKFFWIWFYLILLYIIIKKFRWYSLLVIVFIALLITLSDQVSVHLLKNTVQRLRPCYNEDLMLVVHTVNGCGGKFGFVSSHAANTFALAFFISGIMQKSYRRLPMVMFVWATLVGYSRIYLGVHYPGDILGGAVVGILVGFIVLMLYQFVENKIVTRTAGPGR